MSLLSWNNGSQRLVVALIGKVSESCRGLGPSEVRRLKMLEDENRRLKQMVADLSLDKHMLQDVLSRKL